MLSETIYEESIGLIEDQQYQQVMSELADEIDALRMQNSRESMDELILQRESMATSRKFLTERLDKLLRSLADYLLEQNEGERVELYLRERLIARPADSRSHVKLTDPRYLSDRKPIGEYRLQPAALEELKSD